MGDEKAVVAAKASDSTGVTPYTLFSSDNPGSMISSVMLSGENYSEWATEMFNALRAKRKIGFIDGTIRKPKEEGSEMESWTSVNSMVVGWLRTSITPHVRSTVSFIDAAAELWESLKNRFSVGNKVRIHQLVSQLSSCKQGGQSVMDYYGRLVNLWDELQRYRHLPVCTCGAAAKIAKDREDEKVHQFVMGLDESRFGNVICQIIDADPLSDLTQAYAKAIREEQRLAAKKKEQQYDVVGFVARRETQPESVPSLVTNEAVEASSFVTRSRLSSNFSQGNNKNRERSLLCSHCGRSGHRKDYCWELVGYPEWWSDRNKGGRGSVRGGRSSPSGRAGRGSNFVASGRGRGYATVAHATSPHASTYPVFTSEQWQAISTMALEKTSQNTDKLSGPFFEDSDWSRG
ncbi:PREDICTED: uncharacterized protein LOC104765791 [Camelina sativa]|uniref:Uncharacterized protein LOC104765791 n=1 Tax=Camelina sativa TaxID=90675 RepID=A0ABM0XLV9_CAMSA|nr:PREDICTED: uncharacterized protein LOC104765791 [Camelina sativa]